ncbi:MAG: hypothetical protein ACM3U0_01865 [archaeon]
MKASIKVKIREILYKHYEFGECIIEDIRWVNYGTSLEIKVNYIWTDSNGFFIESSGKHSVKYGTIRPNLDIPVIKTLKFNLVQEFHLKNFLPIDSPEDEDSIGWGYSEIGAIRIEDNSLFLSHYWKEAIDYQHMCIYFSDDRRLDIVFHELEILD